LSGWLREPPKIIPAIKEEPTMPIYNAFIGSLEDDELEGTDYEDALYGRDGNDRIEAGRGNDLVKGGSGSDRIFGGEGNDRLLGGDDNAPVTGSDSDFIQGGPGDDEILGGDGNDSLWGGPGEDQVYGGAGNDRIGGGGVNNKLYGEGGDDVLFYNPGPVFPTWDAVADRQFMDGGAGRDVLRLSSDAYFDDIDFSFPQSAGITVNARGVGGGSIVIGHVPSPFAVDGTPYFWSAGTFTGIERIEIDDDRPSNVFGAPNSGITVAPGRGGAAFYLPHNGAVDTVVVTPATGDVLIAGDPGDLIYPDDSWRGFEGAGKAGGDRLIFEDLDRSQVQVAFDPVDSDTDPGGMEFTLPNGSSVFVMRVEKMVEGVDYLFA
jgi:Ca2+-binding RTX toxin-like protein